MDLEWLYRVEAMLETVDVTERTFKLRPAVLETLRTQLIDLKVDMEGALPTQEELENNTAVVKILERNNQGV